MSLIIALISAVSFFFIPYLIGNLINRSRTSVVSNFIIGSLIHFALSFILYFFKLSSVYPYLIVLISLSALFFFLFRLKFKLNFSQFIVLFTIFLLSCLSYYIYRFNSAYPLPLNWDFFHHQTLVNQILSGRLSLLNSQISDTFVFNGYTPLFHLLLALPQMLFHPDILEYFWWLEFIFALTVNFTVFFLAIKFIKNSLFALGTVIFSAFIFESFMAYTTFMLIPQTLAALVFAGILTQKFRFKKHFYQLIFLFLLHFIIGIGAILLILADYIIRTAKPILIRHRLTDTLILIFTSLLALTTLVKLPFDFSFLNAGEAASFSLTLAQKFDYFRLFSGYFIFIFLIVGFLNIVFFSRSFRLKRLLLLALFSLFPLILPLPYSLKFFVLGHYLTILIVATGFYALLQQIHFALLKSLILPLCLVSLSLILYSSANSFKNTFDIGESNAQISFSEVEAANFLKSHYQPATTLLISDPATQQILEPLSTINTQGGAYMSLTTRQKLINLAPSFSPADIRFNLTSVSDSITSIRSTTYLLVLSSRYFHWQEQPEKSRLDLAFNIWAPSHLSLSNQTYINWLSAQSGFKLVYQNSDLAILELTP